MEKKINRCAFSHIQYKGGYHCVQAGWENDKVIETNEDKCENCSNFKSRYIEYPITINGIDVEELKYEDSWHCKVGSLVAVRPCGEEYQKKTYLGFYIGELPIQVMVNYKEKNGILRIDTLDNPAMFVPELGKIIFGCGSWWHEIKSEDELKQISDQDINNVWYMKLLKKMKDED